METTADLWKRSTNPWPETTYDTAHSRLVGEERPGCRRKPRRATGARRQVHPAAHQQRAYIHWQDDEVDQWLATETAGTEPPTEEQTHFLRAVVKRCRHEQRDLARAGNHQLPAKKPNLSEPMRACLFGIPGAGKSHCIKLIRRFFEECLKWEDGVQFQFLASQNTMAAMIGGATVHRWGVIPVNAADAASKTHSTSKDGDIDELFLNALGLRWLILDECSTLSPGLIGLLDAYLRRACMRHPYADRNGAKRPFGGLNIIFAGDLWQLPPVLATPLFANPFRSGYSVQEQKIFKLFWDRTDDSIQRMFRQGCPRRPLKVKKNRFSIFISFYLNVFLFSKLPVIYTSRFGRKIGA